MFSVSLCLSNYRSIYWFSLLLRTSTWSCLWSTSLVRNTSPLLLCSATLTSAWWYHQIGCFRASRFWATFIELFSEFPAACHIILLKNFLSVVCSQLFFPPSIFRFHFIHFTCYSSYISKVIKMCTINLLNESAFYP